MGVIIFSRNIYIILNLPSLSLHRTPTTFTYPYSSLETLPYIRSPGGYHAEMVKNLKQANVDHLVVGMFHSSFYGAFFNRQFIEQQFHLQSNRPDAVMLIYGYFTREMISNIFRSFQIFDT